MSSDDKTISRDGNPEESESGTSEDDIVWSAEDEKNFLKAYSALKHKDCRIYTEDFAFFSDKSYVPDYSRQKDSRTGSSNKLSLREYEQLYLEGVCGSDSDRDERPGPSYAEHEDKTRIDFKSLIKHLDEKIEGDELLTKRVLTKEEQTKDDEKFYRWLADEDIGDVLDDDLVKLKKRWSKKNTLDSDEAFLRDYLISRKYEVDSDQMDNDYIPTYEEITQQDEDMEAAENFENKYNFRFEDPDQEFLKRYPRTVSEALRSSESGRKRNRELVKKSKTKRTKLNEDSDEGFKFRYRNVPVNDFGLKFDEIISVDDRLLNKWAPINRITMYRTGDEEQRDIKYFNLKGKNLQKKKKIFDDTLLPPKKTSGNKHRDDTLVPEMERSHSSTKLECPPPFADESTNDTEKEQKSANESQLNNQIINQSQDRKKTKKSKKKKCTAGGNGEYVQKGPDKKMLVEMLSTDRLRSYGVSTKKLKRLQFNLKHERSNNITKNDSVHNGP